MQVRVPIKAHGTNKCRHCKTESLSLYEGSVDLEITVVGSTIQLTASKKPGAGHTRQEPADDGTTELLPIIVKELAAAFSLTPKAIRGPKRDVEYARPRQMICVALKANGVDLNTIGDLIHRDRTTVMHAIERVHELEKNDLDIATALNAMSGYTLMRLAGETPHLEAFDLEKIVKNNRT